MEICILIEDLIFSSKLASIGLPENVTIKKIKTLEAWNEFLSSPSPALVIVDLNIKKLNPIEAIQTIKGITTFNKTPVFAFGHHGDVEKLQEAKRAGCDRVMARSEFSNSITKIISEIDVQSSCNS